MDKTKQFLSDLVINTKYAKYIPTKGRREVWEDIVERSLYLHARMIEKLDLDEDSKTILLEDTIKAFQLVRNKTIMPSMRSLQFAGESIKRANHRIYNCSYLPIREVLDFSELFYMLLLGCGVGYSVRQRHIEQLPQIIRKSVLLPDYDVSIKDSYTTKIIHYIIEDSIEGWADAIRYLISGYLIYNYRVRFDYSKIRPKGTRLKTSGGYAPGPEGLKKAIDNIISIFEKKCCLEDGYRYLTSLNVHDIICHLANAVMSGGNRRSAMLCIFDYTDEDMLRCKEGEYWKNNEQRGRANNSVLIPRNLDYSKFKKIFDTTIVNGTGEPGFIWVDTLDTDNGFNPCVEASLKPYECCNCVTINAKEFNPGNHYKSILKAAALIGTLQASYMDTPYLNNRWKKAISEACLLGVSFTGIKDTDQIEFYKESHLKYFSKTIAEWNEHYAKILGINKAHRCTFIKPEGTTSLVCGTSSGLHYYYAPYYIRRVRVNNEFAIVKYMYENYPEFIEPELFRPDYESVISVPIKGNNREQEDKNKVNNPELNHLHTQIEEIKKWGAWIEGGHREGTKHNVSYTLKYKDIHNGGSLSVLFYDAFAALLYDYRNDYSGISIFQEDTNVYKQLPHEEITKEVYKEMYKRFPEVDFSLLMESHDCDLHLRDNAACIGDVCDI